MLFPVFGYGGVELVHVILDILQDLLFGVLVFICIGFHVGGVSHQNTPTYHSV